ncbi:MAG: metallophosphoesterase [Pseudomonadales bacterium]|nr:metallophosphoesterase [Halieaceae bacterium]MCP5164066.1 metallophosphoesterase [Pseudomonadales bacterium]MCP5189657.1 metallophosphoesterase [Pseudomonadales bacterium]MCP5203859.1 metallophosphoesterase [Pseudomonadales bacterium]
MAMRTRLKFLLVALLLHLPLFAYPILRLCDWLGLSGVATALIFTPLFFSQIVARVYLRHANSGPVFWLRRGADLWLGISPLLLCMLLLAEAPVALGWVAPRTAAHVLVALAIGLLAYSVANAFSPSLVRVRLRSSKLSKPLRFVQITDVHIGSRSGAFLQRVMRRVNSADARFLCITGDFIDAPGITEEHLAALRSCSIPIFFCVGNHERYEDLDAILARLRRLGVRVLRSETVEQGEVQLIGIDDSDNPSQVRRELARLDIDTHRFVLLLYHRPRGLSAAAAAGVDLMISGHTHNGQIVPFNLVVKRVFERVVGLFTQGGTTLYVSPGTGTWGPVMRLGSRGEVTVFEVEPQPAGGRGAAQEHA